MIATFLLGAVGGCAATALAKWFAVRWRVISRPDPVIPDHLRPVPYLGGVGIAIGAILSGLIATPMLIGFVAFTTVGLIDDLAEFRPLPKLVGQVAAIVVAVLSCKQLIRPLTGCTPLDILLSGLWIAAVVNAFNFIDVCDGLAGFTSSVALLMWAFLPGFPVQKGLIAAAGAIFGFLIWNVPPARIFMGDAGSHGVGFLLAGAALLAPATPTASYWLAMALLGTALPIFELIFLITIRTRKRVPFWRGTPDHFSLRLQAAGWNKWAIDLAALGFTFVLSVLARVWQVANGPAQIVIMIGVIAMTVCCSIYLLRFEVELSNRQTSQRGV